MSLKLKFRKEFFILALGLFFTSCLTNVEEPEEIDNGGADPCDNITYSQNVKSIIDNNCTQCHSSSGGQFPNLESYSGLSGNASAVLAEVTSRRMPKGGSLTSDQIKAIKCWIESGALNN